LNWSTFEGARSWRSSSSKALHHALAVAALIHVDEIDDNDAAEIAQANLAHDFFDGIHVGFDDCVFEARSLAHVFAGVDVDRDQRFGLVNHDVAARSSARLST